MLLFIILIFIIIIYYNYIYNSESKQTLDNLQEKLHYIADTLYTKHPRDPTVQRLHQKFRHTRFTANNSGSYTLNKGQEIALCLKQRDNSPIPPNTLLFVALHEMAHIMTKQADTSQHYHSQEFWHNFRRLLSTADSLGLYQVQNYEYNPVEYCGQHIDNNPLFWGT